MRYLLDTVTIVRYFTGSGKLGHKARTILNMAHENEDTLLISVVSLMEILYLAERKRISLDLAQTLALLAASKTYLVVDLSPDIIQVAATISFPELHDRLILATAKWLGTPIISSDSLFPQVSDIVVIWD